MLNVQGLRARLRPDRSVLRGLTCTSTPARRVVVIGPNGHGKTTMLRPSSGLIKPVRGGTIEFDGRARSTAAPPRRLGRARHRPHPAGRPAVPRHDGRGEPAAGRVPAREWRSGGPTPRAHLRDLARRWRSGARRRHARCPAASGGWSALGRGMMRPAELLMIDEPSLGLAPVAIEAVYAAIAAHLAESGATIAAGRGELHARPRGRRPRAHPRGGQRSCAAAASRRVDRPTVVETYLGVDRGGGAHDRPAAISSDGVVHGSIHGLVTIGMTLIYGTLRILNMAQGSMVMLGSYVGWWALATHGVNPLWRWCWRSLVDVRASAPRPSWCRCSRCSAGVTRSTSRWSRSSPRSPSADPADERRAAALRRRARSNVAAARPRQPRALQRRCRSPTTS